MHRPASRPRGGFFFALILAVIAAFVTAAPAATLLPNGKQQFIDQNGAPLALGSVQFYIPNTTTPKATWQDANQTILNTNPILLDGSGQGIIYGAGAYRQVVKDKNGNTIWDQLTADTSSSQIVWGGTSGGTANSQTISAANFSSADGQIVGWIAGSTNTSALSIVISGVSINVLKDTISGPVSLTGGEVATNTVALAVYDRTRGAFHLITGQSSNARVSTAASATVDLGATGTRFVNITGTGTISSFGSTATLGFPRYFVSFAAAVTLTNSSNLILLSGRSFTTNPGDAMDLVYLGGGVWQELAYYPAVQWSAPNSATGLKVTNNATTPNTKVDLSAISADISNVNGTALRFTNIAVTIDMSVFGAINGIDTGSSISAAAWYYVYLISNGNAVAGLMSLSATAPVLPSGYTFVFRVGAVRTTSSILLRTLQQGKDAQYVVTPSTNTAAYPRVSPATGVSGDITLPSGMVLLSLSTFVPPTAPRLRGMTSSGSATAAAGPSNNFGNVGSGSNPPPITNRGTTSNIPFEMLLETYGLYWASNDNTLAGLFAFGWSDAVNAN